MIRLFRLSGYDAGSGMIRENKTLAACIAAIILSMSNINNTQ